MNVDAAARAATRAVDRSATRVDPVAGLDDLLRRHRRQPLRRVVASAAVAVLVAVAAIWAGIALRGPTHIQPTLRPVERFRAGPAPTSVAVTPGAAWVVNAGNSTISRIDPRTGRVQGTFTVSGAPAQGGGLLYAAVGEGRLWVVHRLGHQTAISAIDPSTGQTLDTFGFGDDVLWESGWPGDLAIGAGAVWPALMDEVKRYDATGKQLDRFPLREPNALAVDGRTLWVATADGRLRSIDADTGAVRVRATTEMVARIRVGQGGLWLMTFDGKLLRLDRRTARVVAQVPGTFTAADLAVGPEGVWVYDQHQGAVLRIDPVTNRVVRTIPVISRPLVELYARVLAVGNGAVWVVDKGAGTVVRVDPYR
jgi:DNA-binding beta-propeller fold protein YncE